MNSENIISEINKLNDESLEKIGNFHKKLDLFTISSELAALINAKNNC